MSLIIVQLSDIHLKNSDNSIFAKKDKIIAAIKCRAVYANKILILINGDTAFSGIDSEYKVALDFFCDIKEGLKDKNTQIDFLFVGGNHDCDFNLPKEIRDMAIESLDRENKFEVSNEVVSTIKVQSNYDDFVETMESENSFCKVNYENLIYRNILLNYNDKFKVNFNLFNTAWMSEINESPGQMIMPINMIPKLKVMDDSLNISVLHHPTNWLSPNNKRQFEDIVFESSDVILTGHEHMNTNSSKISDSIRTMVIEAGALQENSNPDISEFKLFNIDNKKMMIISFYWDVENDIFKTDRESEVLFDDYNRLKLMENQININKTDTFHFSNDHNRFLKELGAPITHTTYGNLCLDDIYIFPDFRDELIDKSDESKRHIDSDEFEKQILSNDESLWLISGDKESGKTSLIKILSKRFFHKKKISYLYNRK